MSYFPGEALYGRAVRHLRDNELCTDYNEITTAHIDHISRMPFELQGKQYDNISCCNAIL